MNRVEYQDRKIKKFEIPHKKIHKRTVIRALAMPIATDRIYIMLCMSLGRTKIPAPENIHRMALAVKNT